MKTKLTAIEKEKNNIVDSNKLDLKPTLTNLEGKKHCIHKKTFYGMVDGRCVECGGWLSSLGKHPSISNQHKSYSDVLNILKTSLPYYERDDKDCFIYIAKEYDLKMSAHKLDLYISYLLKEEVKNSERT